MSARLPPEPPPPPSPALTVITLVDSTRTVGGVELYERLLLLFPNHQLDVYYRPKTQDWSFPTWMVDESERQRSFVLPAVPWSRTTSGLSSTFVHKSVVWSPSGLHFPGPAARPPPPLAKQGDEDDQSLCVVCLEEKREIAFVPCGHRCCCDVCAAGVRACPLCQAAFVTKVKIFL